MKHPLQNLDAVEALVAEPLAKECVPQLSYALLLGQVSPCL
jgi:hypothetical protein